MRFSSRTPADLTPNPISKAIQKAVRGGIIDLTESNPTRCGFHYPPSILESLGKPSAFIYDPQSFGLPEARQALADYLNAKGQKVAMENIVLTASTSEAYSYLFKILGNPGNCFLVPTPSYPLLEHLLRLEGLELVPYFLQTLANWPVDRDRLEKAAPEACKGLIVVNPHNPTGTFLSGQDVDSLGRLCEENQWAYISDEVFSDFTYPGHAFKPWTPSGSLSFRLGGLSKSLGTPQLKLSWILLDGPAKILDECRDRLELVADTYLSVNTPVQRALPDLLAFAPAFQKQLMARVLHHRQFLSEQLQGLGPAMVWPAQGGWYALVEIKGKRALDEPIVLELLEKHRVLIHPGSFYDFPEGCFLVLSLLPRPEVFQEGVVRIRKYLEEKWGK